MIDKVNGLIIGYPIDKSMLPQRDFFPYEKNGMKHDIIANQETYKAELQDMARLLSQKKLPVASFWGIEN